MDQTAEFKAVLPPPSEAERLEGEAAVIIQGAAGKSLAERLVAAELAAELQRRATALRRASK